MSSLDVQFSVLLEGHRLKEQDDRRLAVMDSTVHVGELQAHTEVFSPVEYKHVTADFEREKHSPKNVNSVIF